MQHLKRTRTIQLLSLYHSFTTSVFAGAILLLAATMNAQAQYNYTSFSVPGATGTYAYGISGNNIVGSYEDGYGYRQGFLYNGSSYTTLSVPGADTFACGISGNTSVGRYQNAGTSFEQGFLNNGSSYTTLDVPGAVQTFAFGISGNNIVGSYLSGIRWQGFLYNGDSYTTLSVPGAPFTYAFGISGNNIVGYCANGSSWQGFLATTVPEPSALALLAVGAGAFLVCRRWPFVAAGTRRLGDERTIL